MQLNKGTNKTPYELWYGYKANNTYFEVFGSKFYILKECENRKFDVKSDEGIFLGYSTKRKSYKCLNLKENKIIERFHVRIDEFSKKNEVKRIKEPQDYKNFIYYEDETILEPNDDEDEQEENESPESPKTPEQPKLQTDFTKS